MFWSREISEGFVITQGFRRKFHELFVDFKKFLFNKD